MNFFFGINFLEFTSNLKIPIFQNEGYTKYDYNLYCLNIKNNKWNLNLYSDQPSNDFYLVNNCDCNNENIFFLASENEVKKYKQNGLEKLLKFNNFTLTTPSFRANLEVNINKGGFSSYQSEYPIDMISKKGSILSPLNVLTNKYDSQNFLVFKNIYHKAINDTFLGYFIDFKKKKIINEFSLKTNYTNFIKINNNILDDEIYFLTKDYIGIPIYLTCQNNHLSFEHTHPPHEYILSDDKFKKVSDLKKEFNEIIS